jgi:hypothetical protein
MKNFLLTLSIVVAACALAYGVFFAMNDDPALRRAARENDAMAWLRVEFHLTDAQFAAVKKLHDDYGRICGGHCSAIVEAKRRGAPAVEVAALEQTCVESMTAHFKRVAAEMPASEGARYLATVLPRVAGYEHTGAPNVRATP